MSQGKAGRLATFLLGFVVLSLLILGVWMMSCNRSN